MKGIRFYQEFVHKGKDTDIPKDICLAVFTKTRRVIREFPPYEIFTCVDSLTDSPNSGYCVGTVDQGYLTDKCRRVTESKAREIAPELFTCLGFFTA